MKRTGAALLAMALLTACGAAGQTSETPQQVVRTASQKMSQLQSAKFDVRATALEQFPQAFTQSLGAAGAALSNLSVDLTGTGQASFPDKASMSMEVKTSSITISTDMVIVGGELYIKNPQTGTFMTVSGGNPIAQFGGETDPLSGAAALKAAQSIKDLGDTTVNGTAVHHYQVIPDKNTLADQATTPQARDLMRSVLQHGTVQLEVWIGKADHLLYRLKDDTDATIDLSQALQASGQQIPSGVSLPAGSTVHAVVHSSLNFHDFNTPVTVTPPPVSSP